MLRGGEYGTSALILTQLKRTQAYAQAQGKGKKKILVLVLALVIMLAANRLHREKSALMPERRL